MPLLREFWTVRFGDQTQAIEIVQKTILLPGCHLITSKIVWKLPQLSQFWIGLLNIFLQHRSPSITINKS
jgi:thiamine phosphate synthase YjbQ (UPF0047 family)